MRKGWRAISTWCNICCMCGALAFQANGVVSSIMVCACDACKCRMWKTGRNVLVCMCIDPTMRNAWRASFSEYCAGTIYMHKLYLQCTIAANPSRRGISTIPTVQNSLRTVPERLTHYTIYCETIRMGVSLFAPIHRNRSLHVHCAYYLCARLYTYHYSLLLFFGATKICKHCK